MSRAAFLRTYKTSKNRLTITDAHGNTHRGPTQRQLLKMHKAGKCGAWCGHCYHGACEGAKT